jgi:hypothetical protein
VTTCVLVLVVGMLLAVVQGALAAIAEATKEMDARQGVVGKPFYIAVLYFLVANSIQITVSFFVTSLILAALLPTTLGRGALVTLCYAPIVGLCSCVLFGISILAGVEFLVLGLYAATDGFAVYKLAQKLNWQGRSISMIVVSVLAGLFISTATAAMLIPVATPGPLRAGWSEELRFGFLGLAFVLSFGSVIGVVLGIWNAGNYRPSSNEFNRKLTREAAEDGGQISFSCEICQKWLEFPRRYAGQRVQCSGCFFMTRIPGGLGEAPADPGDRDCHYGST